jgi:hypothetical protein
MFFLILWVCQYPVYVSVNGMNDEFERIWKETIVG